MPLTLDQLAKEEPFTNNSNVLKLFNELDKVCTTNDPHPKACVYSNRIISNKPFTELLRKIFSILKNSLHKEDIYFKGNIHPKFDLCVYYKYWFYRQIINSELGEKDVEELFREFRMNKLAIIESLYDPCKINTKTLKDVKIIKALYDHILFPSSEDESHNVIKEIKKCEFCDYFKSSLENVMQNSKIICHTFSPNAFCMEHSSHLNSIINLDDLSSLSCEYDAKNTHKHRNNVLPVSDNLESEHQIASAVNSMQHQGSDLDTQSDHAIPEDNNVLAKSTIGGVTTFGIFFTLFSLYKFTSLGSSMRRRTTWFTNIWNNAQDEERELLLLGNSEQVHINSLQDQYNLAYHSA
ncbi:PIR Superfamily Protein [Plasmodium ovale wallikeri]|uniref:PIR Superfamily Protein n=2 Tax=Plasmodium ovale TaxID=36330 RepID=A0A1A9AIK4_PLAOA|nr:PIR Superfamily Protein [Plasmodium ovale wallikeri]SBT58840.1 PIR Superfamily Protein [Plasmodium ovale wallikeri]SBT73728.1 PIR protein [Plasmodium ovale]